MRSFCVCVAFTLAFFACMTAAAQRAKFVVDFEDLPSVNTVKGVDGRAFDLGPSSPQRLAITRDIPLDKTQRNFSATVWVKAYTGSKAAYQILSSLASLNDKRVGWEFSVQANGAWSFDVTTVSGHYTYAPTPSRQSIKDGQWHLLAVTYNSAAEELTFFYDAQKMAIYYAPGIAQFFQIPELVVGNSRKNDRTFGILNEGWESFYGWIDDIGLYDVVLTEEFLSDYYAATTGIRKMEKVPAQAGALSLKVAAFNIWKGGNQLGKEAGRQRIIESLRDLDADVFLLVETYGSGEVLADALGYQLYLISSNLSILSKYPIVDTYRVYEPFHSGGAKLLLPGAQPLNVFCVWLSSKPQYFIKGLTAQDSWPLDDYLREENKTRAKDVQSILSDIRHCIAVSDSIPLIVGGDFNSGSHLDWTEQTKSRHNNYVVPWPASLAMEKAGFTDSFRALHPDPLQVPGLTWSPTRTFPLKDRIDYIYYCGKDLKAIRSAVWDYHPLGWASDHAAVLSTFVISK